MPSFKFLQGLTLAALATTASARLNINNWCGVTVTVKLSHNGGCDYGTDGRCLTAGGQPWRITPGQITGFDWIADGAGTSIKIGKEGQGDGILQFEYAMATGQYGGLYWDLSDLDGNGAGLVGTPFANDNVKVSPTGNGEGQGTCVKIRCAAGTVCLDSYQHPDDPNTRWCPTDTGDMWLDLCQPYAQFITRSAEPEPVEAASPAASKLHRRRLQNGHGSIHHRSH